MNLYWRDSCGLKLYSPACKSSICLYCKLNKTHKSYPGQKGFLSRSDSSLHFLKLPSVPQFQLYKTTFSSVPCLSHPCGFPHRVRVIFKITNFIISLISLFKPHNVFIDVLHRCFLTWPHLPFKSHLRSLLSLLCM